MNDQQITHAEKLIIRQPKSSFKMGIFCVIIAVGILSLMTFFSNDTVNLWIYLFFGLLLAGALYILCKSIVWKVTVEIESIKVRNTFGQTKIIPFKVIERIKVKRDPRESDIAKQILIYSKDGKIILSMEPDCIGLGAFFKLLEQKSIKLE